MNKTHRRYSDHFPSGNGGWISSLLICLVILGGGSAVLAYIFNTEPTAERSGDSKKTAVPVQTTTPKSGLFHPTIEATGTVRPAREVILRPRVSGEVQKIADEFTPGGFVKKGELLVRLDPSDYKNTLQQRKGELRQAKTDLKLEMGRQNVAKTEYELLEDQLSERNRDLVLRKPQLNAARARVESARAAVRQAELELKRTKINAPFNAHVITRNVNVGSQVSPGDQLARLVGLDEYWIEVTVPRSKLNWLTFSENGDGKTTSVRVRDQSGWPEETYRTGKLYKLIGALEDQTRLARVLVSVKDPLLRHSEEGEEKPILMLDAYVDAEIQGREISEAVRLSRDYVRKNDTVWLMSDGKLEIRKLHIVRRDANYAYVREGLDETDTVVTTDLATIKEGLPLQKRQENTTADSGEDVSTSGKN